MSGVNIRVGLLPTGNPRGRKTAGWSAACIALTFGFVLRAQTETSLHGTVLSEDAQPLAGVKVYGSELKSCCPITRDETKTNERGEFVLQHPGAVVHFQKEHFEPAALVVKPDENGVRIVLRGAAGDMIVASCGKSGHGERQIKWGKHGSPRWTVHKHDVIIRGGKTDVDYVRYVVKSRSGKSFLELWVGVNGYAPDPTDELFTGSLEFAQRNLVNPAGRFVGMESWGRSRDDGRWRWTSAFYALATYHSASPQDAQLFDGIINSMCTVPRPDH